MRAPKHTAFTLIGLMVALIGFTSCGQKGPLYLPSDEPNEQGQRAPTPEQKAQNANQTQAPSAQNKK